MCVPLFEGDPIHYPILVVVTLILKPLCFAILFILLNRRNLYKFGVFSKDD